MQENKKTDIYDAFPTVINGLFWSQLFKLYLNFIQPFIPLRGQSLNTLMNKQLNWPPKSFTSKTEREYIEVSFELYKLNIKSAIEADIDIPSPPNLWLWLKNSGCVDEMKYIVKSEVRDSISSQIRNHYQACLTIQEDRRATKTKLLTNLGIDLFGVVFSAVVGRSILENLPALASRVKVETSVTVGPLTASRQWEPKPKWPNPKLPNPATQIEKSDQISDNMRQQQLENERVESIRNEEAAYLGALREREYQEAVREQRSLEHHQREMARLKEEADERAKMVASQPRNREEEYRIDLIPTPKYFSDMGKEQKIRVPIEENLQNNRR